MAGNLGSVGEPTPGETSPIRFTDVTEAAGIAFVHSNGASSRRYLPETMGAGVAFFDCDGDELPDLFFPDGRVVSPDRESEEREEREGVAGRLYRNRGDGTFEDVTEGAGLSGSMLSMGTAVGDVDNDGRADLFVSGVGAQRLYRSLGDCRFLDVTAAAGLSITSSPKDLGFGSSAAFFDADRDGLLDLVVGHYVPWTPESDLHCSPDGTHPTYCTPELYGSAANVFYQNVGGGRFREATRETGLDRPAGKTLGLAVVDHDRDGWPDLAVANDTDRNHLFMNRGDGTFQETGIETGLAFSVSGSPRGAMGIDSGDLNGDGLTDLAIGNFSQELAALYMATDTGLFRDDGALLGVGLPTLMQVSFGTLLADLDLDGRLDLVFANGHIEPEIAQYQSIQSYRQPLGVFHNRIGEGGQNAHGNGGFEPVAGGGPLSQRWVGRGLATADFDGDGDLDLILTQNGGEARLLRNDAAPSSWLRVRLVGARGSATPYGARLTVVAENQVAENQVAENQVAENQASGDRQTRTLRSGSSYLSASEPIVTFGLGAAKAVEKLEILWPSGQKQTLPSPEIDRLLVVREPARPPAS